MPNRVEVEDELAQVYSDEGAARTLLRRIGFPPGQVPSFGTSVVFWSNVMQRLEAGILVDGVEKLIRQAAKDFPGNAVLSLAAVSSDPSLQRPDGTMPSLRKLTDTLVLAYSDPVSLSFLLTNIGLPAAEIPKVATAREAWYLVLPNLQGRGWLETLVNEVLADPRVAAYHGMIRKAWADFTS